MRAFVQHLRFRPLIVLLVCFAVVIGPATVRGPGATAKGAPITLYLADNFEGLEYVPLDPMTLADDENGTPVKFSASYGAWTVSADGSTLVSVEYPAAGNPTVEVISSETNTRRASFEVAQEMGRPQLTRDGALLVMSGVQSGSMSGVSAPRWFVYDSADGTPLTTINGEGQGITPFGFHYALLNPVSERMYVPFVPGDEYPDGPLPLQIAEYDLRTGLEVGRIELTEVMAGTWFPADSSEEMGVVNEAITPGIALSPNGQQLAVADAMTGRITLIHTNSMAIDRTFVPERPMSWLDRLGGWLSPRPRTADAKLMEGRVFRADYSADGRSLYVSGRTVEVGETMDEIDVNALGMQRIDLQSGEIRVEALEGVDIQEVWASPDGSALYVLGYDEPWETATNGVAPHLRRLNAETLAVEAERKLPMSSQIVAAPAPA